MRKGFGPIRRGAVCAVLAVLLILTVTAALAAERYPYTTTTTDRVNLRRSASSTAVVLTRVPKGDTVTVIGKSGSYYRVTYGRYSGFILSTFLVPYEQTEAAQAAPVTVTGYPYETTTNDSVNLRRSNSQVSDILLTIPAGANVTVIGETGKYAHLIYRGTEGYARKEYINMLTVVRATATPAPTPTMAPAANYVSYLYLQQGSTGDAVIALQNALIELGYLTGTADGQYGARTAAAVTALQTRNGYPATGAADANLQAFIYSGSPLNSAGVRTQVKTLAPVDGVTIYSGSRGQLVGTMQQRLTELGYYAGTITRVNDTATMNALKAFQRANGLTADGIAGPQTQAILFSAAALPAGATPTPAPTPTPTPLPVFVTPSATVERGTTGENARLVQQRLQDLGYYTGRVDGNFGASSVSALVAFQQRNGLVADGKAGPATFSMLFSWYAVAANATPTPVIIATLPPETTPTPAPTPTPTPAPITQATVVTVRLGVTGDAVRRLQERLTALGYYQATVDGVCKADDVAAIRTFQRLNGLTVDGAAGYLTQTKLYSESAVLYTGGVAAGTVSNYTTLRVGMSGSEVQQMQNRLIALGYMSGTADGVYGTDTANAVIAFQRSNGLNRDGVAGVITLQRLYSSSAVRAVTATPTPAPTRAVTATATPRPAAVQTLHQGDRSSAVRALQERLIELGYLTGRADGIFGTKTFEAVKAFQARNRLTADGIAGALTLERIGSSSAVAAPGVTVATPRPTAVPTAAANPRPSASQVQYENWYTTVKAKVRRFQYATVYDFTTGISWQVHMFSFGAHADAEPLTANDTARMLQAFGGNTWNPKAVWVVLGDGTVYMASTHSMPHEVQHITSNNFAGHLCIHFPRTQAQVTAIGPYATSHQAAIDAGWRTTQSMR